MVDHAVFDLVDEPVAPKVAASVEVAVVDVLVLGGRRLALLQLHLARQVHVLRPEGSRGDAAVDRLLRALYLVGVGGDDVVHALAVDDDPFVDGVVELAELGLVHVHAGPRGDEPHARLGLGVVRVVVVMVEWAPRLLRAAVAAKREPRGHRAREQQERTAFLRVLAAGAPMGAGSPAADVPQLARPAVGAFRARRLLLGRVGGLGDAVAHYLAADRGFAHPQRRRDGCDLGLAHEHVGQSAAFGSVELLPFVLSHIIKTPLPLERIVLGRNASILRQRGRLSD